MTRIADSYDPRELPTDEMRGELILDRRLLSLKLSGEEQAVAMGENNGDGASELAAYISRAMRVHKPNVDKKTIQS